MDQILADSTTLDTSLLTGQEHEYDKIAQSLVSRLSKLSPQEIATARNVLDAISPSSHTIVYLYTLLATIEVSAASGKAVPRQLPPTVLPEGSFWPYIVQTLLEFDPIQARYCGTQLMRVVDCVAMGAEQTANYVPAIQLLHGVIYRLDKTASTLTSTHRTFIRLCLLSQAYAEAASLLDDPIHHIPALQSESRGTKYVCSPSGQSWTFASPPTGLTQQITSRTYLEYYLMGGMCYMALRRYQDAMFFFEVVLTAPTIQNVASSIMIEAYKKWLLVGLVLNGATPAIPRSAGQAAIKHVRAVAKPYECVAEAFKGSDIERLRAEIEAGNSVWQEDQNYGLMVEVYEAFRKFSVLRLGKTFAALSVAEIAKRTSPDPTNLNETQVYLEGLIANGALNAVIAQANGSQGQILRFLPTSASLKSEAQVKVALASQTRELEDLLRHVQDSEHRIELSREYIDWLKKLKKMKDEEKKTGGARNGRSAAVDDVDEDVMEEF